MEGSDTRLRAGWPTRIVYAGALLGFLPSALLGSSGWLALVLGGGVFGLFGASATLAVAALATFRAYQVLRYPAALDARPPNPLGWLLRELGWLGMLVSAASALGLFFIKPLALLLFRTPGDAGIAYFMVGLVLVILAGAGWLACLVFEVSRVCGPRVQAPAPAWSRRRQDMAVLVMLLVVGVGAPFLLRATAVPPCGENNLAACVSSTEGGVRRMIGLPQGEPVALESSLEEIELRPARGRQWIFQESPVVSLEASGHPVAAADARVRVRVDAVAAGQAATVTLAVNEGEEETARFVTHFPKGAKLERGSAGGMRLVVDLPSNAEPGMRSTRRGPSGKQYFLDQLFIQMRGAIGSELEAREWPMRVVRPATLVESSQAAHPFDVEPAAPSECKARVSIGRSEMLAYEGHLGWPLQTVTFVESPAPEAQTLMDGNDRLVCRDADIWIVSYYARRPALRVRRFSADGKLLRFIDTAVPPTRLSGSEFEVVQASSVREEADGRVRFERWVISGKAGGNVAGKRDVFELAP
jgi:hypothetical protein